MQIVDLLVTIVVVTILVTIVLAVITYVAYKLRLSREPAPRDDDPDALRYFVTYPPPAREQGAAERHAGRAGESNLERLDRDVASLEAHAPEA